MQSDLTDITRANLRIDTLSLQLRQAESKLEESERVKEHLLQEAQCHAMEARTQRNTVNEVGSLLGGVGDWGPIVEGVAAMKEKLAERDRERDRIRDAAKLARYYLKGYSLDSNSATHAKRVIANMIHALTPEEKPHE